MVASNKALPGALGPCPYSALTAVLPRGIGCLDGGILRSLEQHWAPTDPRGSSCQQL